MQEILETTPWGLEYEELSRIAKWVAEIVDSATQSINRGGNLLKLQGLKEIFEYDKGTAVVPPVL